MKGTIVRKGVNRSEGSIGCFLVNVCCGVSDELSEIAFTAISDPFLGNYPCAWDVHELPFTRLI